jgi:hypothetical protein
VVETGVSRGTSAIGILTALLENEYGLLHSIDLPGARYRLDSGSTWRDLSNESGPGWLIPEQLKPHWKLHLGSSKSILPELLGAIGPVQLFYHDSEHTKVNMDFELQTTFDHLSPGSYVLVDNANWSDSFTRFCSTNALRSVELFPFLGVTRV